MSIWIYCDADNTLWDTDALFAEAQLALLKAAEELSGTQQVVEDRLSFVRDFDQEIAARHHAKLRYPPALLLRALREGLGGTSAKSAAQRALAEGAAPTELETTALRVYSNILLGAPPILPTVRKGLELAWAHTIPVYVISEGPLEPVRTRLHNLELDTFISGTLSAVKTPELYERLKQRATPHEALMIGDQPDRDIRFAHDAGLKTILVASRFRPHWIRSGDIACANAVVNEFLEAIKWAVKLNESHRE